MAHHMPVAYHTAVQHNLVECLPVSKLAENFHVLHRDAVLEHDCHILVHHIHGHSPAGEVLPEKKELDVHNLDPVVVHNCNLTGMGADP